jgi:4-hydroxybenzoate polyprenyltransferase
MLAKDKQIGTDGGKVDPPTGEAVSPFTIHSAVLCVDFDGTLTPTDSLYECLALAIRRRPWCVFLLPFWLLRGRAYLKERLFAAAAGLRVDLFPRNPAVAELIAAARAQGRTVELVSAAHVDLLRELKDPDFAAVLGSEGGFNLKGPAKAAFLAERHTQGFAYVGDSAADIAVWQVAAERFGVGLSSGVRRKLVRSGLSVEELAPRKSRLHALWRAMRPHQWVKNLLVFVTLALGLHNVTDAVIGRFVATFFAFCLLTSGTYIVNDLTDLAADRQHPRKRFRPLASGALPIPLGIPAALALIVGGLAIAFATGLHIAASLLVYLALTFVYSFGLKRLPIVDVLAVATLFTARIVAGAFGYDGPVSTWIIVFSLFLFTSLALMKRTVETGALGGLGTTEISGRGYRVGDHAFLMTSGIAFGIGAVIIFSLYASEMVSTGLQYRSPDVLWVAVGMLSYWVLRMWLMTTRGEMNEDPILFAVRDRVSIGLGVTIFVVAVLAQVF